MVWKKLRSKKNRTIKVTIKQPIKDIDRETIIGTIIYFKFDYNMHECIRDLNKTLLSPNLNYKDIELMGINNMIINGRLLGFSRIDGQPMIDVDFVPFIIQSNRDKKINTILGSKADIKEIIGNNGCSMLYE